MARVMPTMEQFMVGAYVQLVEGCDLVTYNAGAPSRKMFWIEVVGRAGQEPLGGGGPDSRRQLGQALQ